jgi:hypothetical protein
MGMMKMGMMKNCPMMRGMMQGGMKGGEMQGGEMQGGMMQGGMMDTMMQRMASDAVGQSVMQVYLLPALRDSLSLSDDQAARLEDLKQQFAAQRDEIQADSRAQERQFDEVMGAEQPDLGRAEALLTDRAALEADAQMAALRAAARMKEVLSGEQRAELAALEPIQMHRAMMQNLPMRDMMQMMGDMMMADMQMSCPMMKDGMPMGHGDMTGHGDAMQQENE